MPRLLTLLAMLVLALALAACGGDDKEADATPKPAAEESADPAGAACKKVEAPEPKGEKKVAKPTEKLAKRSYSAQVTTSCGQFTIELDAKRAPTTAGSFVHLAEQGFFDGLVFHRIVPGFVIQGGDPSGDGSGGPGYSVVESPPKDLQYTRGVVAMAKTLDEKPGTSGSQFFVVTGEDAGLPAEYALLGKVSKGQDVVDLIGTVQTDQNTERPASPVVIEKVEIVTGR